MIHSNCPSEEWWVEQISTYTTINLGEIAYKRLANYCREQWPANGSFEQILDRVKSVLEILEKSYCLLKGI